MTPSSLVALLLETAINGCLRLDPESPARLAEVAGTVIAVTLTGTPAAFGLYVRDDATIEVLPDLPEPAHASIAGTPVALARALSPAADRDAGLPPEVTLTGDTVAAQRFARVLRGLRIDWEEQLSLLAGDVPARAAGNALRALSDWSRRSRETLLRDLSEYVVEEARLAPDRAELARFHAEVDALRDDLERLEKRIARLPAPGPGRRL